MCDGPSYTPGLCLPTPGLSPSPQPPSPSLSYGAIIPIFPLPSSTLIHPTPVSSSRLVPLPSISKSSSRRCIWVSEECFLEGNLSASLHSWYEAGICTWCRESPLPPLCPASLPHSCSSHCDGLSQLPVLMCRTTAQGSCDLERSSAGLGARIGALAADEKYLPAKIC